MDFMERECIFLSFFWLSLGALGRLIEPYPANQAVLVGTPNVPITCHSSLGSDYIFFYYLRVGDSRAIGAKTETIDKVNFAVTYNANKSLTLTIRTAHVLMAGSYHCDEGGRMRSQVIILTENPTCSFSPRQTKQLMCNDTITLSCSVSYLANWTYVVPNLKWSTDASSEGLMGSMVTTQSGNITTATSTLKVTWPAESPTAIPVYSCNTTFSLVDGLSTEFSKKPPDYFNLCKPFTSPDDVPCTKEEPKTEGKTSTTDKKNEAPTVTTKKKNEAPTDTAEKNETPTVTVEKHAAPTFTTEKKKVTTTDEVAEKRRDDTPEGSSVVSSDTNIVLLSVAGSLLLAQAF